MRIEAKYYNAISRENYLIPDEGIDVFVGLDLRSGGELGVAVIVEGGLRKDLPAQFDGLPHLPPVDLCKNEIKMQVDRKYNLFQEGNNVANILALLQELAQLPLHSPVAVLF